METTSKPDLSTGGVQYIVGIEFLGLTHWDRYILNENLAKLEKEVYPDLSGREKDKDGDNELWRGNKRRFYRLDTRNLDLEMELDFKPANPMCYVVRVLNLSPAGCRLLLPGDECIKESTRIPRVRLKFGNEEILIRARVTYVSAQSDDLPESE